MMFDMVTKSPSHPGWWKRRWTDWRRGYSAVDVEEARERVDALPVKRGRPPDVVLRMTLRQWRAFFGEEMTIHDGLDSAPDCHLPPVLCQIIDRRFGTMMALEDVPRNLGSRT